MIRVPSCRSRCSILRGGREYAEYEKCAKYAKYAEYAECAKYAEYAECAEYAQYADHSTLLQK